LSDAILGQVALGYSPSSTATAAVTATRLTVFPLQARCRARCGAAAAAVGSVWPADGARVSLNVASESLLTDLLKADVSTNVMIEVPAFMAADAANVDSLLGLHARGNTMLLKGRPLKELPREVLPCFRYSIIDLADDRRATEGAQVPAGIARNIAHVQSGVGSVAEMEASFNRGAAAVLGWPIDDVSRLRSHAASRPARPACR
jgi:EAL and modified HD-GYP domain-containing signal transduction protein